MRRVLSLAIAGVCTLMFADGTWETATRTARTAQLRLVRGGRTRRGHSIAARCVAGQRRHRRRQAGGGGDERAAGQRVGRESLAVSRAHGRRS